jgi:Zn-dependent M28 family amino/carboxypeptidase
VPDINKEWVVEQLQAAKVKVGSGKAIMSLLETWAELPELSDKMKEEVLTIFPLLAKGHVVKEEESDDDYMWIPVQPGSIVIGDVVRVKADAFQDKLGPLHNGRRGTVVAVRYGDVIFNDTDGKKPALNGVHYSPYKLEKRVRKAN